MYQLTYLLVEGDADRRFMERVVEPMIVRPEHQVRCWMYSGTKKEVTRKFLQGVKSQHRPYFYFHDLDSLPCPGERKRKECETCRDLDINCVIVVGKEIEAWYLAGLDQASSRKLGIRYFPSTDDVTKETFEQLVRRSRRYKSPTELMLEILECFSVEVAKQKNRSFAYLSRRLNL